ncbi:MAG: HD domain-containing protein [Candidatus Omnitrophica bacterium]|nr:HD domain-containing protein [Candidatus Omnitrophota bacterium]MDD5574694.1 HD domain-containing protein [Candidatus Omnitrophota bacterium]
MKTRPVSIPRHPILHSRMFKAVTACAAREKRKVYLVGGFLRDLFAGRRKPSLDLDFSVDRGAIDFGRKLARRLKSGFVVLDREHGCCRLVLKDRVSRQIVTLDFVDFRAPDFCGDLEKRDFTINTLAVRLPVRRGGLLDLCGGGRDMRKKVVRAVGPFSFDEDPLRILRAFSLSASLKFTIDPATRRMARQKKEQLKDVAGERLRDEFFKILAMEDSWRYILEMDALGVLENVIPQIKVMHHVKQGGYHHLDVWGHSLETVRKLEEQISRMKDDEETMRYLDEPMTTGRTRRQLIKLAALLHDIGKPKAHEVKAGKTMFHGHERIGRIISDAVAERLRLATREKFALDTIIFWHLRPGYLADNKVLTKRAIHRFFRDTKEEAVSVLLVSIADQRATRGPMATKASRLRHEKVSFSLIEEYFASLKREPFVRLINGKDLIKKLKLAPGPIFSKILNAVEDAQVEGRIRTKQEALALARKMKPLS